MHIVPPTVKVLFVLLGIRGVLEEPREKTVRFGQRLRNGGTFGGRVFWMALSWRGRLRLCSVRFAGSRLGPGLLCCRRRGFPRGSGFPSSNWFSCRTQRSSRLSCRPLSRHSCHRWTNTHCGFLCGRVDGVVGHLGVQLNLELRRKWSEETRSMH